MRYCSAPPRALFTTYLVTIEPRTSRYPNPRLRTFWRGKLTTLILPRARKPRSTLTFVYSDGFGREINEKNPGGAGAACQKWTGHSTPLGGYRVDSVQRRGQGGAPVRAIFSATHRFESDVRAGISPMLFYDPIVRRVATLNPNHTGKRLSSIRRTRRAGTSTTRRWSRSSRRSRRRRLFQSIEGRRLSAHLAWDADRRHVRITGAGSRTKNRTPC